MAPIDRYAGPNGEAVPPLTKIEREACAVSSMYLYLATGQYVQFQPVLKP